MPSSSGRPAALRSPPTTTADGLSRLQWSARTRPIARPASVNTRWAPRSPARTRATASRTVSSSRWAGASAARPASVAATGSRQPRLPRGGAAAPAAAADGALVAHVDVADLAGQADRAVVEAPAEHEARADARGDLDVQDVGQAARGADRDLAERTEVGVVVDLDRDVEAALELRGGPQADPVGQDHRRADGAGARVDRAGQADAGADDPRAVHVGLGQNLVDHLGGGVQGAARGGVDVDLGGALGQDRARQVGERDAQVVMAEVDAQRASGRRVEAQQDRRAAAAG